MMDLYVPSPEVGPDPHEFEDRMEAMRGRWRDALEEMDPHARAHHQRILDEFERRYGDGDRSALMDAVTHCAEQAVPVPPWAAQALISAQEGYKYAHTRPRYDDRGRHVPPSWDRVLGPPWTPPHKGASYPATWERNRKLDAIVARVRQLRGLTWVRAQGKPMPEGRIAPIGWNDRGAERGVRSIIEDEFGVSWSNVRDHVMPYARS